jgi:hypothetical protein
MQPSIAPREQMRRRQSGLHAVELGVEWAQPHGAPGPSKEHNITSVPDERRSLGYVRISDVEDCIICRACGASAEGIFGAVDEAQKPMRALVRIYMLTLTWLAHLCTLMPRRPNYRNKRRYPI